MADQTEFLSESTDDSKFRQTTRTTSKYMTRYEKAKILGIRSKQISENMPVLINVGEENNALNIAMLELEAGVIPIIVRRFLPDGNYEDWKVSDLIRRR
jgi:DNA-directed RNA polymerase I, II, and III subunit RPABC2